MKCLLPFLAVAIIYGLYFFDVILPSFIASFLFHPLPFSVLVSVSALGPALQAISLPEKGFFLSSFAFFLAVIVTFAIVRCHVWIYRARAPSKYAFKFQDILVLLGVLFAIFLAIRSELDFENTSAALASLLITALSAGLTLSKYVLELAVLQTASISRL